MKQKLNEHESRERQLADQALCWYGWGSPVGLGLFATLIALAIALIKLAFR